MISRTITVTQYEVGDILDISLIHPKLSAKRRLNESTRALVVDVTLIFDGTISYKLITDSGHMVTFKHDEQGNEKYIGHVDLGLLFG